MNERSNTISKLRESFESRCAYVSAKLSTLVPSQIRALRLKSDMPRQSDLAREANMKQSRISMLETPGAANVTLDTLSRIAAAFKVGVIVKFVPFSEMLRWENNYSQDNFDVVKIDKDNAFLNPTVAQTVAPQIPNTSWISIEVLDALTGSCSIPNASQATYVEHEDIVISDNAGYLYPLNTGLEPVRVGSAAKELWKTVYLPAIAAANAAKMNEEKPDA